MPTYVCSARTGLLSPAQKAAIARAITAAHAEITGAPAYFAQVIFTSINDGDHFMGGAPLVHQHLFVHGRIRAGRSAVDRKALVRRLSTDVAAAAGLDRFGVWVYLQELPAAAMVEFGHVLPEPGDEASWTAALPEGDRDRMAAIGRNR
jgi:phenylpyruvate tautomerase PptA (4-oxalocrotonate tautomerase family)